MDDVTDLVAYLNERNKALAEMDLEWGRRRMPGAHPEVVRIAMHKARVFCTAIDENLRRRSMVWLKARGYGPRRGEAWPKNNQLPE